MDPFLQSKLVLWACLFPGCALLWWLLTMIRAMYRIPREHVERAVQELMAWDNKRIGVGRDPGGKYNVVWVLNKERGIQIGGDMDTEEEAHKLADFMIQSIGQEVLGRRKEKLVRILTGEEE